MSKKSALIGFFIYASLYGIVITLLQLGRSRRFTSDIVGAGKFIKGLFEGIFDKTKDIAKFISGVSEKLPNETVGDFIHGILYALIYIIAVALLLAVAFVIYRLIKFCYTEFGDVMTLSYMMFSLSLIVWGTDLVGKKMPLNIVVTYLICLVIFFGIRCYIDRELITNPFRIKRKKEW